MFFKIIQQFNWVDIFILITIFRICYIGFKKGLTIELFKLLGVVLAIYLSLHYYTFLSDFVGDRIPFKENAPLQFVDLICFLALVIIGLLIMLALREAFHMFIKMEAVPKLNKFGGLIFGAARGILVSGLITFMFVTSTVAYFKDSVSNSYLGKRFFVVAPLTYSKIWYGFMSKFTPKEKFNEVVLEVQKDFKR